MTEGFWLSEAQFERISECLPTDTRGVARADDRRVISGIIHVLQSGCRWKDAPKPYLSTHELQPALAGDTALEGFVPQPKRGAGSWRRDRICG